MAPGAAGVAPAPGIRIRSPRSIPKMRFNAKTLPFMLAFAAQRSARTSLRLAPICVDRMPALFPRANGYRSVHQMDPEAIRPAVPEQLSVYAVDDKPLLTEIYTGFLEAAGYLVKTFNDRIKALAALKSEKKRPDLLITDYLGLFMPVDHFMHACRLIHPNLRILMASGFDRRDMRLLRACPDGFIEKPFTPEELLQRVRAALVGS